MSRKKEDTESLDYQSDIMVRKLREEFVSNQAGPKYKYNFAYTEMRTYFKNVKIQEFPKEWEENIYKLLSMGSKGQRSETFTVLMQEVAECYKRDMEKFIETLILSDAIVKCPFANMDKQIPQEIPINHSSFLRHRASLMNKYFLYLDVVKAILSTAHTKLPKVLCDFKRYHQMGLMTLNEFESTCSNDIRKGSLAVTNKFYVEASNAIGKSKMLQSFIPKRLTDAMRCITNVFVQQIINVMIRSIDHMINIMEEGQYCPQIRIQLVFEDRQFYLSPTVEEISETFYNLIESIINIAHDLMPLEEWLNIRANIRYIKIKLPEWYVKEAHNKLQAILEKLYEPLKGYLLKISKNFQPICEMSTKVRILSVSSSTSAFDSCLKRMHTYKIYITKSNELIASEYYKIGKLEQSEAKVSLKKRSQDVLNMFVNQMIKYHCEFNKAICRDFEELSSKALNVPKDAKELMELSEYISHASKTLLKELELKIRQSIHMLNALLDITVLTDEHIDLNRKTVNWFFNIGPVIAQNNSLTEAMKSELEDDMQNRINSLNTAVEEIVPQLSVLDEMDDMKRIQEYVEYYKILLKQVNQIDQEMQSINEEERLFRFPETEFPKVIEVKEIIMPFYSLIHSIYQWRRDNAVWLHGPFEWLDASIIEQKTVNYFNQITETNKTFRARIKMDVTANKCFKFSGIADDPDPMQQPVPLKLCWQTLNDINEFKTYLTLITCMCNPALQKRHWDEMSGICHFDLTPNAGTTLKKIIAYELMPDIEKYEAISISANRELALQRKLCEMKQEWDKISFEMRVDKETNKTVFRNLEDIETLLADHATKIQEMQASNFVKPIESDVTEFSCSLERVQQILDYWDCIQERRLCLQSMFSYPSIEKTLTTEKSLYTDVERVLLQIENRVSESPNFQNFDDPKNLKCLRTASEKLEIVDKSVREFMQAKRTRFARFFFLSDKEIQNVLFDSINSEKPYLFLRKCFTGIYRLRINKNKEINSVFGRYWEVLRFSKGVRISEKVGFEENWLLELEKEIVCTVQRNISQCCEIIENTSMLETVSNYPSMAIVCAFRIRWTSKVHECLEQTDRSLISNLHIEYIRRMNSLVNDMKVSSSRRQRSLFSSLIIIMSHHIDVIKLLIDRNISETTDFVWIAQLRYYIEGASINVSTFNAVMKYGYEYDHYEESIVNTALTDRCFHTLMQAYRYNLYGSVIGPSNSGKTETFKSLAKAIAVQFHILNCNRTLSYTILSQILKGFVTFGAWLCFENFDKLKLQVLSAIAQKFVQVRQALSANLRTVFFDEVPLPLNTNGHICTIMTLNPFLHSTLPDNLKMLFRTVAMKIPDLEKITEIELFAAGFSEAKQLALKMATVYKILSEQLWCDTCSDFNPRTLKVLIKSARRLKKDFPNENESMLILRSLINTSISRLCYTDTVIFRRIVHEVFPVDLLPSDYSEILTTIEVVCKERSIPMHDTLKLKIIQTFEILCVQRGLILIGEAFVGKTSTISILADALTSLHDSVQSIGSKVQVKHVIPGVSTYQELFGYVDKLTGIWKDGICSKLLQSLVGNEENRTWIVFDGPLNDIWMETLYTLFDPSGTLYLSSGETINVPDSVSIIFETMDTVQASPATLSRCGIVYIESNSVDWKPYATSHISRNTLYDNHHETLYALFDWVIDPCLEFVEKNCTLICSVNKLHMIRNTLVLLDMHLDEACSEVRDEKGKMGHFVVWVQAALLLAIAWGFGGALDLDSNVKFNAFSTKLCAGGNPKFPKPESIKHFEIAIPSDGLIQDYFYVFKGIGNWKLWNDLLKGEKVVEMPELNQVFVPTANTLKYSNSFLKHIKHRRPFIVFYNETCGMSTCVQHFLKTKLPEGNAYNLFSLVSLDSIERAKRSFLSKLNKLKKRHYGLPRKTFCTNFIDDLNVYHSELSLEVRNILELLRQYLTYGYFYETNEPERVLIHDVMFCLGAKVQTRKINMCQRFLRHFNCYSMSSLNNETISRIFSNVLFSKLRRNLFAADVQTSVTSITNATINVYNCVIKTLLPVPSKVQYCFNTRDIARVINGCSLLQKESVETKLTFIRLWVHEIWRVFGDRVHDKTDREWLFETIKQTSKTNFKDSFETAFDYLPKDENNQITMASFTDLTFGNFMDTERTSNRKYEEINSIESLKNKIQSYLDDYNSKFKKQLDIVLTRYALDCVIKISRIMTIPAGNLIMIASAASGRRSIVRLAAFIQKQTFFEPSVYAYTNETVWKDQLKSLLRECGGGNKDSTFYLPDKQLDDSILRDISSLLATGEVPSLLSTEDKRAIVEMVRLQAQSGNRNAEMSIRAVMDYFSEQCKNKLHLILCLSPTSDLYKSYLRTHPILLKHCTINCYDSWPTSTFQQIGVKYVQGIKIEEDLKLPAIKASINFYENACEMCEKYYKDTGRITHVTPPAYLHMLRLYSNITSKKQNEIVLSRNRYLAGLEKLELAAKQVAQMKTTLTILKPQLEQSAQQTIKTMKEVEHENSTVEKATILVKQEEEIANKKTEIAGTLRTECEADLAVAIPILEDAVAALNTLKPTDITLVKAMKNPPDTVKLVMAAVCVMLGVPPDKTIDPVTGRKYTDYWSPSKRILGDMNFLQNLKEYDKDNIPVSVMQTVKKTYMTDNSFMPHIVAKASSAAEGLCKWVRAIVSYDEVAKVVAPKKEKLNAAQRECDEAEAFLNEKRRTLAALNAKLAALNSSLQATLQEKLKLENEVANCTEKLKTAENLIASLGGEKSRWMECAVNLQENYDNLIGDILLSSAIIAYLAPYSITYRDEILEKWKIQIEEFGIRYTRDFHFTEILGDETEFNYWYTSGLPKNRFSTENAIIMNHSEMSCLLIDSQSQANQWIKMIERKNDLAVVKLTDTNYMSVIQKNIEFGKPILIENVGENLDVLLDPILLKELYNENEITYLDTGMNMIKYSSNCRLYITTRLMNPRYSYEIFSKVTIIDFSIPEEALQDRLLDVVISKEKPELQETFKHLLIQDAANKRILKQQEENILITLSSTTSNILEDKKAIQILDTSKNLSLEVSKKQEALELMTEEISEFRKRYIQFAKHSAGLFSTLNALCRLNHMYRFSFSWFIQLYIRSIDMSNRSNIPKKRLEFLKTSFTQNLHQSVCRSLCEKHKILYSFLLSCKILLDAGEATEEEIKFFLTTTADTEPASMESWLPPDILKKIDILNNEVPIFKNLIQEFSADNNSWKEYYNSESLKTELMPEPWQSKLTQFQKLILLKTLRPNNIFPEILKTIDNTMGSMACEPPQHKISKSYAESSCLTPLIFILPSAPCPLSLVTAFASKKGYTSKLITLSMGEGQEKRAETFIKKAREEGGWVILQNCHYVPHWMVELEEMCETNNSTNIALDFRLWLSSNPFNDFPIGILHSSIKMTYDYPLSFNQHLLNLYQSDPIARKEFFEGCPGKDKLFSKLLFGLCFFHIVVMQRNYFGTQGWSSPYDFNYFDLNMSMIQLQDVVNSNVSMNFHTLLYLIGDCNYGGKMENEFDRTCLRTLLECYCNKNINRNCQGRFSNVMESLIPQRCEYLHTVKHIESIPVNLPPETFGANENNIIIRDTAVATEFLSMISDMNRIDLPIDEESIHSKVLIMVNDTLDTLPDISRDLEHKNGYNLEDPMDRVLLRELELLKHNLDIIRKSLETIKSVLNGKLILSGNLACVIQDLFNIKVPRIWKELNIDIPSSNLSHFIKNIVKRGEFIRSWINHGEPKDIWFDAMTCHKMFLSAILLKGSKKYGTSLENIFLDFSVAKSDTCEDNIVSYNILGLHLSGARWDIEKNMLEKSSTYTFCQEMLAIKVQCSKTQKCRSEYYDCPVYVTAFAIDSENSREFSRKMSNYIFSVPLSTNLNVTYWTKSGTALYCHIPQK